MKFRNAITAIALIGAIASFGLNCKKDTTEFNPALLALVMPQAGGGISGNITANATWKNGTRISGATFIQPGVTVTVNAGSTIYADNGSSLFVLPGAKLNAIGTATQPVVFTSSNASGKRARADWGGLVIIGKATSNLAAVKQTEGSTPQNYGNGTNDADSSGTLKYVRIEFAGNKVGTANELNCLSSYTVGSGTTYDHIQCHMSADDSYEFFGGAVNGKYMLSTGADDDDFDFDEGYHGKMQYILGYKYEITTSELDPRGFEHNGACGSTGCVAPNAFGGYPNYSTVKVGNFTLIGSTTAAGNAANGSNANDGMRLRFGMTGTYSHGLVFGFGGTGKSINCTAAETTPFVSAGASASLFDIQYTNGTATAPNGCTFDATVAALGAATSLATIITATPNINLEATSLVHANLTSAGVTDVAGATRMNDPFFTSDTGLGAVTATSGNWLSGWTYYKQN